MAELRSSNSSSGLLNRLRGSLRSKKSTSSLANDLAADGNEPCPQCRASALVAHRAAYHGHVACLAWLAKENRAKLDTEDQNGASPLLLAVRQNRLKVVRWLLGNCPGQSQKKAKGGESPVLVAAALGRLQCLQMLLEFDPKIRRPLVEDVDSTGMAAIHLATLKDRVDTVAWLLKELGKPAVSQPTSSGITSVHIAAASGHLQVLASLLKKDKKGVAFQDGSGTTPAYFAAQEGRLECFQHLVDQGKADPVASCNDGMTPAHCAAQGGHLNIIQFIVAKEGEHIILAKTEEGATPVHFAAAMGHTKTLEWILSLPKMGGLAKDIRDADGGTPGHDAADNNQLQCLLILKSHGANLMAKDNDGYSPVDLAVNSTDAKCQEWGAQMMRQASWETSGARQEETQEIHAAVAAATLDQPEVGSETRGLTASDREKSGSREINIDEAVFEAAKKDSRKQRSGTLPNPKRRQLNPTSNEDEEAPSEDPYAVPMRLLAKTRSNTIGHRPNPNASKDTNSTPILAPAPTEDQTDGQDQETSLVTVDYASDDAQPKSEKDSPVLPPRTAESQILLAADSSGGESESRRSNARGREKEPAITKKTNEATKKAVPSLQVVVDGDDRQAKSASLPAQRRKLAIDQSDISALTPDSWRKMEKEQADGNRASPIVTRVQRKSIFDSPSNTLERGMSLAPPPLPDPSKSPVLAKRMASVTKSSSESSLSDFATPSTVTGASTKKAMLSDSSSDDDDDDDDEYDKAKRSLPPGAFTKVASASKILVSSSNSSSADESD